MSAELREAAAKGVHTVDELAAMIMKTVEADHRHAEFDPNATFGVKFTARVPESPAVQTAKIADVIAMYVAGATTGGKKKVAMQQVLQLLRALPSPLRDAVLRAVTGVVATDDDGVALRDLAAELPADEVLHALQYLAGTANLSEHALALLRSLISTREHPKSAAVDPDFVEDLVTLFGDEDIDRFNPPDHQVLLEQVSIQVPIIAPVQRSIDALGVRVDSVADDVLNRHLARTLL